MNANETGVIKHLVQEVETNWITSLIAVDADTSIAGQYINKIITFPKPVIQYMYIMIFFNATSQTTSTMNAGSDIPFIIIPTNYFQSSRNINTVDKYFDDTSPKRPWVRTSGPGVASLDFYWPYEKDTHDENTILWLKISGPTNNPGRYEIVAIG